MVLGKIIQPSLNYFSTATGCMSYLKNKMPMTVYLDIAKAFDTINYNIILLKLCQMGFDSAFLRFCASNLTDRQKRVVISCGKSDFQPITSGGPQGSIFTVFLFSVYINDLPEVIVNECYLFADDTKIVSTVDNRIQLEKDTENAIVWSKENRLNFNFDKFKNVQFSLRKYQNKHILQLPSNGAISQETHFKDLGIYFSENLSSLKFCSTKSKSEACLSKDNHSK